jgi:hypothetical protein
MDYFTAGPVVTTPFVSAAAQDLSWKGCHDVSNESLGLPTGFPVTLDHDLAWTGARFKNKAEYVCQLTEAEIAEVNSALVAFKGRLLLRDTNPHRTS